MIDNLTAEVLFCFVKIDYVGIFSIFYIILTVSLCGPRQANLVLTAYASSEGSGGPAHPRSLARTAAARSYKQ